MGGTRGAGCLFFGAFAAARTTRIAGWRLLLFAAGLFLAWLLLARLFFARRGCFGGRSHVVSNFWGAAASRGALFCAALRAVNGLDAVLLALRAVGYFLRVVLSYLV